jgi:hypothetical protein
VGFSLKIFSSFLRLIGDAISGDFSIDISKEDGMTLNNIKPNYILST